MLSESGPAVIGHRPGLRTNSARQDPERFAREPTGSARGRPAKESPVSNADDEAPGPALSIPAESLLVRQRGTHAANSLFDEFWSVYPRKVGKAAARRQWQLATRRGTADPRRIIDAAQEFRDDCRAKGTDPRYIPHPGSWLGAARYEDEVPGPALAAPSPPMTSVPPPRREWDTDEQLLAAVIRLTADQEHPVSSARVIIRTVRAQFPAGVPEGFPFVPPERARELAAMPYGDYLLTAEWQERRKAMLRSAGNRCMVCNRDRLLNVHHRTYERRGAEHPADLIVLCEDCHGLFHGKGRLCPPAEDVA